MQKAKIQLKGVEAVRLCYLSSTKYVTLLMLETVAQFWAQNLENKSTQSQRIINLIHFLKKTESSRQEATFIKVASKRMEIPFTVLSELNLENCLFLGHLEILKQKNHNMEEILRFWLLNQKLHTSLLILLSMISLWWVQMVFLTKWKIKISLKSSGVSEINQTKQIMVKVKAKNSLSLGNLHPESLPKPWQICPLTTLLLCL